VKRREVWFEDQLDLDPGKLVFIDETGAATNMARLRGRAQKGERLRAGIPRGHWKTTTFVAGLRLTGMTAPMVLDGPMNGAAFLAYVEQVLVPELKVDCKSEDFNRRQNRGRFADLEGLFSSPASTNKDGKEKFLLVLFQTEFCIECAVKHTAKRSRR